MSNSTASNKHKIIFFDLDGTLLTPGYELLPETISAIEDIKALGYRISVATGRSYKSAEPFVTKLEITEPMVFSNGCLYGCPMLDDLAFVDGIPLESALVALMILPEFDLSLKAHLADGTIYKTHDIPWPGEGVHFEQGEIVDNLKAVLDEDPIKMVVFGETDELEKFKKRLSVVLGRNSKINVFNSNPQWLEISSRTVSKGQTIRKLLDVMDIKPSEVIAVGDQDNDFDMLKSVGMGVQVGSVAPKLENVSAFKIPEPENGGIRVLYEKLVELKSNN